MPSQSSIHLFMFCKPADFGREARCTLDKRSRYELIESQTTIYIYGKSKVTNLHELVVFLSMVRSWRIMVGIHRHTKSSRRFESRCCEATVLSTISLGLHFRYLHNKPKNTAIFNDPLVKHLFWPPTIPPADLWHILLSVLVCLFRCIFVFWHVSSQVLKLKGYLWLLTKKVTAKSWIYLFWSGCTPKCAPMVPSTQFHGKLYHISELDFVNMVLLHESDWNQHWLRACSQT